MWSEGGVCAVNLPTAEFELFDNVTDLLKPVRVTLLFALIVGDHLHKITKHQIRLSLLDPDVFCPCCCARGSGCSHQEGGSLKQKNFICLYDLRKISQVCLQLLDVWDELVHYARPGLQRQKHSKMFINSVDFVT